MQHPMRATIRLDDVAHSTVHHAQFATLFVPGAWAGRCIALKPAPGVDWSSAATQIGQGARLDEGWDVTGVLEPGRMNELIVHGGSIAGAVLEAADPLHIVALKAWQDSPQTISIRVRLSRSQAAVGHPGLLGLVFTLTDPRGGLIGSQEVAVDESAAELTAAMPVRSEPPAMGRLKAVLIRDGQVVDDAWIPIGEPHRTSGRS